MDKRARICQTNKDADTMQTLKRFRDLSARLRTHFKSSASETDFTDEGLLKLVAGGEGERAAELPKGFAVMRNALDYKEQLQWARKSFEEYAFFPHNNLSALRQECTDRQAHLKKGTCKTLKRIFYKTKTNSNIFKVRWSCLGMNYDWTNRIYVEGWKSEFPTDLASMCCDMAHRGGFEGEYTPEAAIVNFYTPSMIMGPHRDDAELTMTKPIVSISLGCHAIFCIENHPFHKDSDVACVWVRSGDVVVMAGESRQALHGVAVTIPESFEIDKAFKHSSDDMRLAKQLVSTRININVRQVEDPQDLSCTFEGQKRLVDDDQRPSSSNQSTTRMMMQTS